MTATATTPFVLGLDIGYSGVKMAYGNAALDPMVRNLPAGAAPLAQMPKSFDGASDLRDGMQVLVDGVPYAAGVRPGRIQNYSRVLHEDYPASTEYLALFYAALRAAGRDVIDVLVTGLPVSQHAEAGGARRRALAERLERVHYVDGKHAVTIRRVIVLPQPVGAYMDQAVRNPALQRHPDARVLVVDPGYYSMDWVCIESGGVRDASSGTTMDAMSKVLEVAARDIADMHRDGGGRITIERLEAALREGHDSVLLGGRDFDYRPYVTAAAERVAASAVNAIRSQMRAGETIDFIVLAGGAAPFYERSFRRAFPHTQVLASESSVLANARGFFLAGRRAVAKAAAA